MGRNPLPKLHALESNSFSWIAWGGIMEDPNQRTKALSTWIWVLIKEYFLARKAKILYIPPSQWTPVLLLLSQTRSPIP